MDSSRGGEPSAVGADSSVVTCGRPVSDPPIRALLSTDDRPRFVWETATERVAALGGAAVVSASGPDRFETVQRRATQLFETSHVPGSVPFSARPRFFGGFSFHEGDDEALWRGFGDAAFVLPAVQLTEVDDQWWLTVTRTGSDAATTAPRALDRWVERLDALATPSPQDPPGVTDRQVTPPRTEWRDQVTAALDSVSAGDLEKVVLAQSLALTLGREPSVPDAIDRLGRTYPDCNRFAFSPKNGGTFFGATPEQLVSLRGRTVRTEAIAGSTGRGDTPEEDEWLANELLDSRKDRHEHDVVADAIRAQLEPLAASVTTGDRTILRLATVQHIRTPIAAELATDEHVLSLVEALHPTPAVGGIPPDGALRTIRETEAFDRGWYAAPIGWFDAAGDGTFAVAIRSAIARERTATLFAGAGIVADSDPDAEWDELQLKYRPIVDVLQ